MAKEVIIDPEWGDGQLRDWSPDVPSQFERRRRASLRRQEPGFEVDGVPDTSPPFDPDPAAVDAPPDTPRPRRSRLSEYVGMLLSGSILGRDEARRAYPYMILVALLMLLYISSGFRMQQLRRREIDLTRQVKELRATAIALESRRMAATRQSAILAQIELRQIPLEELTTPPKVIKP